MPSARQATAAAARRTAGAPRHDPPRQAPHPRPRGVSLPPPLLRVRWDRAGRVGLLVVLTVVVGLYVQHTLSYLSISAQASRQEAIVDQLTRQNQSLAAQQHTLQQPATLVREARSLGMIRPGERSYVITGHSGH
jgi:cell division protein FtsB